MRIINRHYSNLLEGYNRITEYQRQFDDLLVKEREHVRRINAGREANHRAQLDDHRARIEQLEAMYARACSAWEKSEQPTRQVYERKLVAWRRRLDRAIHRMDAALARERARLAEDEARLERARDAGKYLITLPFTVLAEVYYGPRIWRQKEVVERLRTRRNLIHATPEPPYKPLTPQPPRPKHPEPPPAPDLIPLPDLPTSLLDEWWTYLQDPAPWLRYEERDHPGLAGEMAMLDALDRALDDTFIAIHGVLVHPKQDGDIVVLGGNGIWVLECKHVAGRVSFDGQTWRHEKLVRYSGGRGEKDWREKEGEDFHPSEQWKLQYASIRKTIFMHMRLEKAPPVTGGVVFTIDETELNIEGCPVTCGKIPDWVERIANMPVDLKYTERDLVTCAHHILDFSHYTERDTAASASDVAEMLYNECTTALQQFKAQYRLNT